MSPWFNVYLCRTSRANSPLHAMCAIVLALAPAVALAQPATPPPGAGQHRHGPPPEAGMAGQHGQMDAEHAADMELFHYLADHGTEIRRTITALPGGVDTVTESDNPEVAGKIQAHVASMKARVEAPRPIHRRDPLFAEVFANADKIKMSAELTPKGVRVVETSDDAYVARLIQAHAEVVSLFIKNGRAEMMKNHEVPAKP